MSVTLIACDRHLATGREDRALGLAAVVKEAERRQLLSVTSPFIHEHRHTPLQPLPQHQHAPSAIGGGRCHRSPPSSRFRLWISFEKHPRQSRHDLRPLPLPFEHDTPDHLASRSGICHPAYSHRYARGTQLCPDRLRPPPVRSRAAIFPGTPQYVSLPKNLWPCPIPVKQKVTT